MTTRAERLRSYGLTEDDYDDLLLAQGGVCAICEYPPPSDRRLAVDHCHKASFMLIRGLLCTRCNVGLGFFNDDQLLLARAISYLDRADAERWSMDGATPGQVPGQVASAHRGQIGARS